MSDQSLVDRYLKDVDSYLNVASPKRERVLGEIESHLRDSAEAHIALGVPPRDAMRRAVDQIGSPKDVATQFLPTSTAVRSVRGWRRWAPIMLPAAVLSAGLALTTWNLIQLRSGSTEGVRLALRYSLLYTVVAAGLSVATFVAIRNGDRDPAWRRAAWTFATLTVVLVGATFAL